MKTRLAIALAFALLLAPLAAGAQQPAIAVTNLKVGQKAPNFTLLDNNWHPVTLSSFRGQKNVILAFYVLAFTSG